MKTIAIVIFLSVASVTVLGSEYNRVPAGLIKGARLSRISNDSIKISPGYGEIMGSYWEITPTDPLCTVGYSLTGLTPTSQGTVNYIYVSRAASSLPNVAICDTAIAPTWSDEFFGWYNGMDRCIGAVWVNPDGSLTQFYCPDEQTYIYDQVSMVTLQIGAPSTTPQQWQTYNVGAYVPVNAFEVRASTSMTGTWTYCQAGIKAENGNAVYGGGARVATALDWVQFARGVPKRCMCVAWASSTSGTVDLTVRGYRLER